MAGLGKKLHHLRRSKDLSQDEFGHLIGVHGRQISRYENDRVKPSGKVLKKYADFFGIAVDDLLRPNGDDMPWSTIQDKELYRQFLELEKLNEDEKAALKKIIQAVITKNRVQHFLLQQD